LISHAELAWFCERFDSGHFWESHESLEPGWLEAPNALRHGLILYASAWVHVLRNNTHGVLAQLAKARVEFETLPGEVDGVHVAALLEDIVQLQAAVTRRAEDGASLASLARGVTIPRIIG
jgi:predicted metal-dependent hydrolase